MLAYIYPYTYLRISVGAEHIASVIVIHIITVISYFLVILSKKESGNIILNIFAFSCAIIWFVGVTLVIIIMYNYGFDTCLL